MQRKYLIWIALTFISILCVGCSEKTKEITYSNLIDHPIQMEISKLLANNGVSPKDIDLFVKRVQDYNHLMKDTKTFKEGFITIQGEVVNYDISYAMERWSKSGRTYGDLNSRMIAYGIFKDYIQCGQAQEVIQDLGLLFDLVIMDNNPLADRDQNDRKKFMNLYEAIPVANLPIEYYGEKIQETWEKRGITFKQTSDLSMVNAFVYNQETEEIFVAKAGVLIEVGGHILYLEKYGPLYPYQATRFKTRKQLKRYIVVNLEREYGQMNKPFIIIENNEIN